MLGHFSSPWLLNQTFHAGVKKPCTRWLVCVIINITDGDVWIAYRTKMINMAQYSCWIVQCWSFILFVFFLHSIFSICNMENVGHEHVLLRLYQVNTTFKSFANIDFLTVIAGIDQLWPLVDGIYSIWAMLPAAAIYSLGFLGCSVERLSSRFCITAAPEQQQDHLTQSSRHWDYTEPEARRGQGLMKTCVRGDLFQSLYRTHWEGREIDEGQESKRDKHKHMFRTNRKAKKDANRSSFARRVNRIDFYHLTRRFQRPLNRLDITQLSIHTLTLVRAHTHTYFLPS